MSENVQLAYRAAVMYYLQGQTMEVIGSDLGVSRSTVSRLLASARETGLVQVSVRAPEQGRGWIEDQLERKFGVRGHVVPVRQRTTEMQRLDQVADVAARLLGEWFDDGEVLGVAWGTTVAAVLRHLQPNPKRESAVVQLNGSANVSTSGIAYGTDLVAQIAERFDAAAYYFPVPAFFDYPETKLLMWQERSIRRVHEMHARVDVALFGIGAPNALVPSHVYSSGYLDDRDTAELQREQVVGDVCTVLLREDGSYRDISLNDRASGPDPEKLRRIKRRICVAAGNTKVRAIVGALRARVATDLIIDELTARAVIAHR